MVVSFLWVGSCSEKVTANFSEERFEQSDLKHRPANELFEYQKHFDFRNRGLNCRTTIVERKFHIIDRHIGGKCIEMHF